jgi:hypothetical protein
MYRYPRSAIETSLSYVVPEADAKQVMAAPNKATALYTYTSIYYTDIHLLWFYTVLVSFQGISALNDLFESAIATKNFENYTFLKDLKSDNSPFFLDPFLFLDLN